MPATPPAARRAAGARPRRRPTPPGDCPRRSATGRRLARATGSAVDEQLGRRGRLLADLGDGRALPQLALADGAEAHDARHRHRRRHRPAVPSSSVRTPMPLGCGDAYPSIEQRRPERRRRQRPAVPLRARRDAPRRRRGAGSDRPSVASVTATPSSASCASTTSAASTVSRPDGCARRSTPRRSAASGGERPPTLGGPRAGTGAGRPSSASARAERCAAERRR